MDIRISAASRDNLLSLQRTSELASRTQNRLATGLKVTSALDDPNAFFKAKGFDSRANDLTNLLSDMNQSVQTIKAADNGIKAIEGLLEQAKAKASQASASSTDSEREAFRIEFEAVLDQIETVARDSGYNGTNLLANSAGTTGESLRTQFNEDNTSSITITGADFDTSTQTGAGNLAITTTAADDWTVANQANVDTALTELTAAFSTVRTKASSFATSLSVVQSRIDFTEDSINNLREGSGKLVLADQNEEGANLLALQTRQQLGTTALSLTAQAEQGVLRLF